jgi:hypothetical protein
MPQIAGTSVHGSGGKSTYVGLSRPIPGFFLRSGADKDMNFLALPGGVVFSGALNSRDGRYRNE